MKLLPLKTPSAWIPMVMSVAALGLVVGHIMAFGIVRETDEGTPAHLFQLLMGLQVPVILYFAARWIPRQPKQAIQILLLQGGLIAAAWAPVFYFKM